MSTNSHQGGFTLAELLVLIVVLAIALVGILTLFNTVVVGSVDPMVRKQAMAVAESMMEEVLLQPFAVQGVAPGTKNQTTRATFNDTRDYDGFATTGIYSIANSATPITGLAAYNVSVAVTQEDPSGTASASWLRVRVRVTGPRITYDLDGYKVNF